MVTKHLHNKLIYCRTTWEKHKTSKLGNYIAFKNKTSRFNVQNLQAFTKAASFFCLLRLLVSLYIYKYKSLNCSYTGMSDNWRPDERFWPGMGSTTAISDIKLKRTFLAFCKARINWGMISVFHCHTPPDIVAAGDLERRPVTWCRSTRGVRETLREMR